MATIIFDQTKSASGSNGSELWIDLGLIPTGLRMWIGSWTVYGAKADSFYLYTNKTGKSTAIATDCTLLASISAKAGATVTQDLYKRGTLHTVTTYGTGVEHWWICIKAKSTTLASYSYKVVYTTE
jgi:hypothetical protein